MNGPRAAGDLANARIVELEHALDPKLRNRGRDDPLDPSLHASMREWSAMVWGAAVALGPSVITSSELERGLTLTGKPVFVCGAARSGTTLVRDLLDGHPQLAVVPAESVFYTSLERALFDLGPGRQSAYLGRCWLERLINPPPYWLLGSSRAGNSPYVKFARDFAAWWQIPDHRSDARISSWPMAALALAYARQLGGGRIPPAARRWVEKSPTSERFLDRIRHDFPAAKVIHVVRQPEAVLASLKAFTPRRWSYRAAALHAVRYMAPSYRIADNSCRSLPPDRYCLIRYEELTADPEQTMSRIADFLGIEPSPSLLQPTVAGRPATNNSSFGKARPRPDESLDPIERAILALTVARSAARLGYRSAASVRHAVVGASPAPAVR